MGENVLAFFGLILGVILLVIMINILGHRDINLVSVEDARAMVDDPSVIVLDVRTLPEYQKGHLQRARLIAVADLPNRINELSDLKDKPFLVYCHAGNRSATASHLLRKSGFTNISNLRGGITAWTGKGYSTVKGD
jgi:rhodanese-related sulfurtransferase